MPWPRFPPTSRRPGRPWARRCSRAMRPGQPSTRLATPIARSRLKSPRSRRWSERARQMLARPAPGWPSTNVSFPACFPRSPTSSAPARATRPWWRSLLGTDVATLLVENAGVVREVGGPSGGRRGGGRGGLPAARRRRRAGRGPGAAVARHRGRHRGGAHRRACLPVRRRCSRGGASGRCGRVRDAGYGPGGPRRRRARPALRHRRRIGRVALGQGERRGRRHRRGGRRPGAPSPPGIAARPAGRRRGRGGYRRGGPPHGRGSPAPRPGRKSLELSQSLAACKGPCRGGPRRPPMPPARSSPPAAASWRVWSASAPRPRPSSRRPAPTWSPSRRKSPRPTEKLEEAKRRQVELSEELAPLRREAHRVSDSSGRGEARRRHPGRAHHLRRARAGGPRPRFGGPGRPERPRHRAASCR